VKPGEKRGEARRFFTPSTPQLGTAIALVSIAAFFVALIVVYAVTVAARPPSMPIQVPRALWLSTALIAASSCSFEMARFALRRGRVTRYNALIKLTALLGAAFVSSQLFAWQNLAAQGVYLRTNPRGSMYYIFTGAHGIHLLGGIVWLIVLIHRARHLDPNFEQTLRRQRTITTAAALYWHFMGVLWICLFALLCLWT
jgi:cytochrome c oxidase subunit 3